ncbi:hypothetical protein Q8F55_006179 [Vanrija albida]|uniref:Uncharacterized protein n=1 Tax=Vanrija albida TaxID=181172 RepID=A0ABR3PWG6_9TREE
MSPTPPASMSLINTVHAHIDSLGLPRVTHMFGTPPPSPGEAKSAPPPPPPASYPSSPYLSSPAPVRAPSPRGLPTPVSATRATHAPTGLARFSTRLTTRAAIMAVCALALLTLVHFLVFIEGAPLSSRLAAPLPDADVHNFKVARLGQAEGVKVAPNGWVGPYRGGLPIHAQRA